MGKRSQSVRRSDYEMGKLNTVRIHCICAASVLFSTNIFLIFYENSNNRVHSPNIYEILLFITRLIIRDLWKLFLSFHFVCFFDAVS